MRRVAMVVMLAAVLALAACSERSSTSTQEPTNTASSTMDGATVTLRASTFDQSAVTISAGQAVRFVDPTDGGGTHMLCLGTEGHCDEDAQDPADLLSPGLSFTPGTTHSILFLHPGSHDVTCTLHPSMQLTISVVGTGA